jgi:hypothetical protein
VLLVVAEFAVAAAVFDLRPSVHQADASHTLVVALALVVAVLARRSPGSQAHHNSVRPRAARVRVPCVAAPQPPLPVDNPDALVVCEAPFSASSDGACAPTADM